MWVQNFGSSQFMVRFILCKFGLIVTGIVRELFAIAIFTWSSPEKEEQFSIRISRKQTCDGLNL